MIARDLAPRLEKAAGMFPVVTVTGPRQSGKSTLCRAVFPDHAYANLEAPDVRDFALTDPRGFLAGYPKGAVLDEIQRAPGLLSYMQEVVDRDPAPRRWILTGSQDFALLESVSQSLAGRAAVLHLLPLTFTEVSRFAHPPATLDEAMFAGGYPRIFDRGIPASEWIASYVATYIERDVRSVSNVGDLVAFQRFLELCAGRSAQLVNYSQLASDAGITQPTAKAWLSVLEASFIVFRLPAYSGSVRKRLVKSPKLHFVDTGLLCWLLGVREPGQLRTHPLRGAVFETWVVSEVLKHRVNAGERGGLSYYRDARGLEADLLIEQGGRVDVVEAKAGQTIASDMFGPLRDVRAALSGGGAEVRSTLVYGGDDEQRRTDATAIPWRRVDKLTAAAP